MNSVQNSDLQAETTPKELALRTLEANQDHQYALAQHAEKLTAELAELDKLLVRSLWSSADTRR
jgi:hypothetical protein